MPDPRTTRPFRYVALGFGLGAVALLGVAAAVTLGRTTVTITLAAQEVRTSFSVAVDPAPGEAELRGRYLETEVTGRQDVAGSQAGGKPAKAHGAVRLVNTTGAGQPLAATTRLVSAGGVLFRTTKRVDVPAQGELAVEVEADQPGPAGEIGPSRFTLPGLRPANQALIYGVSDQPMTGGTVAATTVAEADREAARTALETELKAQALKGLEARLTTEGLPLNVRALEQTTTPRRSSDATVSLVVRTTAVALETDALTARAEAALRAALPAGATLEEVTGQPELSVSRADATTGRATLAVTTVGRATPDAGSALLNPERFTERTAEQVRTAAAAVPGVTRVDVRFSLPWLTRTPASPDRIRVILQLQSLTAGGSTSTVDAATSRDSP